jgi:hypothetical protein
MSDELIRINDDNTMSRSWDNGESWQVLWCVYCDSDEADHWTADRRTFKCLDAWRKLHKVGFYKEEK